jgi:hypothetical protein
MYLIHVALASAPAELPASLGDFIRRHALPEERIEHVSVHAHAVPRPTLGVFVLADRLAEAEVKAADACRRALALLPALSHVTLVRAEAPLMEPLPDPEADGNDHAGPNRPRPVRST